MSNHLWLTFVNVILTYYPRDRKDMKKMNAAFLKTNVFTIITILFF